MNILFLGTGEISLPSLRWLLTDSPHHVGGVVTQPDKAVGRHGSLQAPTVKTLALEHSVPVLQPEKIGTPESLDALRALEPDLILVVAYGQILPRALFEEIPRIACINLHASLLPRHRGASPIQTAIREGDPESGITVMHITKTLDAGDMILKMAIPVDPSDTGQSLHDKLADLAVPALSKALDLFAAGTAPRSPQDDAKATYAPKLSKSDGRIDWTRPAEEIERLIRAYHPWPGTFTTWTHPDTQKPITLKIFPPATATKGNQAPAHSKPGQILAATESSIDIATSHGSLSITTLQAEGRKRLPVAEFLRGTPLQATHGLE